MFSCLISHNYFVHSFTCFPLLYSLFSHFIQMQGHFRSFSPLCSFIFVFRFCLFSPSSAPSFLHSSTFAVILVSQQHICTCHQTVSICDLGGGAKKGATNGWRVSHFVDFLDFGGINVHKSNFRNFHYLKSRCFFSVTKWNEIY